MTYDKEFLVENEKDLHDAKCPGCGNKFKVRSTSSTAMPLNCVKCGSNWYGRRKEIK